MLLVLCTSIQSPHHMAIDNRTHTEPSALHTESVKKCLMTQYRVYGTQHVLYKM